MFTEAKSLAEHGAFANQYSNANTGYTAANPPPLSVRSGPHDEGADGQIPCHCGNDFRLTLCQMRWLACLPRISFPVFRG